MHTLQVCIPAMRLQILPLSLSDTQALQHLFNDPDVLQYIPDIQQPFSAALWATTKLKEPMCYIRHVVRLMETGEMIGYIEINRRRDTYLELGYIFGKRYWGKRYALESILHVLQLVLSITEQPIYASIYAGNGRSVKLLQGIGFRQAEANSKDGATDFVLG